MVSIIRFQLFPIKMDGVQSREVDFIGQLIVEKLIQVESIIRLVLSDSIIIEQF